MGDSGAGDVLFFLRLVGVFFLLTRLLRLVFVLGAQAGWPLVSETVLACGGAYQYADALATAPFFSPSSLHAGDGSAMSVDEAIAARRTAMNASLAETATARAIATH